MSQINSNRWERIWYHTKSFQLPSKHSAFMAGSPSPHAPAGASFLCVDPHRSAHTQGTHGLNIVPIARRLI